MPADLPAPFVRRIRTLHGEAGQRWLDALPGQVARLARRWSLEVEPPFPALTYAYVAPARGLDGSPVVLKIGLPEPELLTQIDALRHYDGRGAVRLLDARPDEGALLLERLLPGTSLRALPDDDQATRIAAGVMQALWRPLPPAHPFPTVARWAGGLARLRRRFDGGSGPLPAALLARAEEHFSTLLASAGVPLLLHGDLHHDNILAAGRAPWLALDPKGLAGDPGFEVGPLMLNPMPDLLEAPFPRRRLVRRLDILSETLGMARSRLLAWTLGYAVLSAWWSIEDHGQGWEPAIEVARHLAALEE